MPADCPLVQKTLVIGDDAPLLAQTCSILARANRYLPVLEGPRMKRPDGLDEVVRRNNTAALLRPETILLVGVPEDVHAAFVNYFPKTRTHRISTIDELKNSRLVGKKQEVEPLRWGRDRIGLGLLHALRAGREMCFTDTASVDQIVPSKSGHLLVCEEGNELAQTIAANYAYSLGAGMCLIPRVSDEECDQILEHFYNLYENNEQSPTAALEYLRKTLREHAGAIPIEGHTSVTFVTGELPWGFAFPEVPTTHLFMYPDLGTAILNGVVSEQPGRPGIRVANLVDPGEVQAREVEWTAHELATRAVFVKGFFGSAAKVHTVSRIWSCIRMTFS